MKYSIAVAILLLLTTGFATRSYAQIARANGIRMTIPAAFLDYRGNCPVDVPITATLTAEGPGLIKYQFIHSSGPSGPVQQLLALLPGQREVREKPGRNMAVNSAAWEDTVFLRILSNPNGNFDSAPVKYSGRCENVTAAPRTATTTLGPAEGRFRVTINGFTCNERTDDRVVINDGAGDEIYLFTKTYDIRVLDRAHGTTDIYLNRVQTPTYGDVSLDVPGFPRVRAGTAAFPNAQGGIVNGDSYPESPQKLISGPASSTGLPQLVWEGTLKRFENGVVILPTIWEADGDNDGLLLAWRSRQLDLGKFAVGRLISNPYETDQFNAISNIRADIANQVLRPRSLSGFRSHPVGIREVGTDNDYRLRAEPLILTYDEALRMVALAAQKGQAFPITYVNAPQLGGSYTIWVQVEKLP